MRDDAADPVFLMVQSAGFTAGDVAAMVAGHAALLADDPVIGMDQAVSLAARDFTLTAFMTDAVDLVVSPLDHFGAAGVVLFEAGFSRSGGCASAEHDSGEQQGGEGLEAGHCTSLSVVSDARGEATSDEPNLTQSD
jgi:hypothetical protein